MMEVWVENYSYPSSEDRVRLYRGAQRGMASYRAILWHRGRTGHAYWHS